MDSLTGKLLLASPVMGDPTFARAVILMIEHSDLGAMGLVLNRPTETRVDDVWDQISILPCPIDESLRKGGPCEGPLMVLHSDAEDADVCVCDGVGFSTQTHKVTSVIEQPQRAMTFFVGYSGWGPGQLESELDTGSWLITQATPEVIFDRDCDDGLWMRTITRIDRAIATLAMNPKLMPHDASMN